MDRPSDLQTVGTRAALTELGHALNSARVKSLYVSAIVDPASFARAWPLFGSVARQRGGGSLFVGTPQAQDPSVAPLLVPLLPRDQDVQHEIATVALGSPAVVWLSSALPAADLVPKLVAKLHAELAASRQLITLRYFDPRVLPELQRVLNASQKARLNEGIQQWWWLDRYNKASTHEVAPEPAQSPNSLLSEVGIALTDDQVTSLLNASFVDRVIDILTRSTPACIRDFDRAQRHAIAEREIEAAARWGVVTEFDCASFIAVSMQHGPAFGEATTWAPLLAEVKAGRLSFSDAIEAWEATHENEEST